MPNIEVWQLYKNLKTLANDSSLRVMWNRTSISLEDNLNYNTYRMIAWIIVTSGGISKNDMEEFNFIFDTEFDVIEFQSFVLRFVKDLNVEEALAEIPDILRVFCDRDATKNDEDQYAVLYVDALRMILVYFAESSGSLNENQTDLIVSYMNSLQNYMSERIALKSNNQKTNNLSQATIEEKTAHDVDAQSLEDVINELNNLIGLNEVKSEVSSLVNFIKIREIRRSKGLAVPPMSLHLVFTGNPGTGKTSVARLVAKLYHKLGILKSGHLVEVDRSGLVAGYVGQTALKVKEVMNRSKDGVLFIDEAYSLTSGGDNDYGREAIEIILKEMEDNRDSVIVIVAGYSNLMSGFLNSNPGLKSRFNRHINFPDYGKDELIEIFHKLASESGYHLDPEISTHIDKIVSQIVKDKDNNFANAREIRNLFEICISRQANRLSLLQKITDHDLNLIKIDDFPIINNEAFN